MNFTEWQEKKKKTHPLLTIQQKVGDQVYFGVHDLVKYYRKFNQLPKLELTDILDKCATIKNIDPVNSEIGLKCQKNPYHYGYRNLKHKSKSKDSLITLSANHLIDISDLMKDEVKIWLVIDSDTKYQQYLIKAIKKKEMKKYMDADCESVPFEKLSDKVQSVTDYNNSWKLHNDNTSYRYY